MCEWKVDGVWATLPSLIKRPVHQEFAFAVCLPMWPDDKQTNRQASKANRHIDGQKGKWQMQTLGERAALVSPCLH